MTERNRTARQCSDACLHYELARAELWSHSHGSVSTADWSRLTATPSISVETARVTLRHVARQCLETTEAKIAEQLCEYMRRVPADVSGDVDVKRISLRSFASLLESLELVANAEKVVEDLWGGLLRIDDLLLGCVSEESKSRAALELEERTSMEHVFSSRRRLEHVRVLQERLVQCVHLATVHAAADAVVGECSKVSLVRRVTRVQQQQQQESMTEGILTRIERLDRVSNTFVVLHEQLRVSWEQEGLLIKLMRDEQAGLAAELAEKSSSMRWEERLRLLERDLGILGRFAIGLSVSTLGRREHDAILCQMQYSPPDATATATAGDFSWLTDEDGTGGVSGYCAPSTMQNTSPILQQCVLSPSCYKARDAALHVDASDAPTADTKRDVETILRRTFASLTRLNYVMIPFLQKNAATLDTVVLFPPFELFVTMCELNVIGSAKLAFFSHCSRRLDAEIAAYVKSLVREEDEWMVDYAMSYDDFVAFISTQASVEHVRHAHLFSAEALLKSLVEEVIRPKWLMHLKQQQQEVYSLPPPPIATAASPERARGSDSAICVLREPQGNVDLCLLLDTGMTWLEIAGHTLRDFAMAYRRHVMEYAFSTRPAGELDGVTTTREVIRLLFSKAGDSHNRCSSTPRWKYFQQLHGRAFVELGELLGGDGSLDGVTAWLSVFIDSIDREELMRRIVGALESIFRTTWGDDDDAVRPGGVAGGMSCGTPLSWILTLAICVKLSFDRTITTPTAEDLLCSLVASH